METIHTQTMWSRVGQAVGQAWQSSKTKIVNMFPSWETIKITAASLKTRTVEFGGKAVNWLPSIVKNHPVVTASLVIACGISTLCLLYKCAKNETRTLEAKNQKLQKQTNDYKFDLTCAEDVLRSKDRELRNTSASLQATQIMLQSVRHQLTETQNTLNEMQNQNASQESQASNSSDAQEIQDENRVNTQENAAQTSNEIEQPVKRGRGRPRKLNNAQNQGNVQAQPKKKPGRPRKNA